MDRFCNKCQAKVSAEQNFCIKCGASLPIIDEKQPEIQSDNNICLKCGVEVTEEQKFCHKCGTPTTTKSQEQGMPEQIKKRFCRKCGAQLDHDDIFCGECGVSVSGLGNNQHIQSNMNHNKPKKKSSVGVKVAIVFIIVMFLTGGYFGVNALLGILWNQNLKDTIDGVFSNELSIDNEDDDSSDKKGSDKTLIKTEEEAYGIYVGPMSVKVECSEIFPEDVKEQFIMMEEIVECMINIDEDYEELVVSFKLEGDNDYNNDFGDMEYNSFEVDLKHSTITALEEDDGLYGLFEGEFYIDQSGIKHLEGEITTEMENPDDPEQWVRVKMSFTAGGEMKTSQDDNSSNDTVPSSTSELSGRWVVNSPTVILDFYSNTTAQFSHEGIISDYIYTIESDVIILENAYSNEILEIPYRIINSNELELYLHFSNTNSDKWVRLELEL